MRTRITAVSACLTGLLLVAGTARGQGIVDPISVIKAKGTSETALKDARVALIAGGGNAVQRIVNELLTPAVTDVAVRINGAVCLASIAETVATPPLKDGLMKCAGDESPGVRYWALIGLSKFKDLPEEELAKVLRSQLEWTQPRWLRLTATRIAQERKIASVAPWLGYSLLKLLPEYESARYKVFAARPERGAAMSPAMESGMTAPMSEGPVMMVGPETALEPRSPAVSIDVDRIVQTAPLEQLKFLAERLEATDEVSDIRTIGAAMESLTGNEGEKAWGFMSQPPWSLQQQIRLALDWYDKNRAAFTTAPRLTAEEAAQLRTIIAPPIP